MIRTAREVLESALRLPSRERAKIAQKLCESLESDEEAEWREELARRLRDVEEGRVELIPAKKVHADARRAIARRAKNRR